MTSIKDILFPYLIIRFCCHFSAGSTRESVRTSLESGGDESGCDKSVEAIAGVSGWGHGWTEKVDCSGTEGRVGDVHSILGSGVPSVDSKTTSLATVGTGSDS